MKKDILFILFILLAACFIIFSLQNNKVNDTQNPAFLGTTFDYYAKNEKRVPIHAIKLNESIFDSIKMSVDNNKPIILILGNSQSQSINQLKVGDRNLIEYISNGANNYNIISHTMPNANFTEMYLLLRFWSNKFKISQVIVPAFLDDTRMAGIRKDFIEKIINDHFLVDNFLDNDRLINDFLLGLQPKEDTNPYNLQRYTEYVFDNYLNTHFVLWRDRSKVESFIAVSLYNMRNTIFNIKASDKRKILPAVYKDNMSSLLSLVNYCSKNKIVAKLYIPPIRNDVEIPYEVEEYEKFKFDCMEIVTKDNYKNFENIVPPRFWGQKMSTNLSGEPELDYMHFQNEGHKILSDSLLNFIKK